MALVMLLSKEPKPLYYYLPVWLVICSISAAPSFLLATGMEANVPAMILGIFIFALIYSSINACQFYYNRIVARPLLHKALTIGFTLRLILTFLSTLLLAPRPNFPFLLICDAFPGMLAIAATQFLLAEPGIAYGKYLADNFLPTLITTLIQGVLLSIIAIIVSMIVWAILSMINRFKTSETGAVS